MVTARHGRVVEVPLESLEALDPSAWLDAGELALAESVRWPPPRVEPVVVEPLPVRGVREILGDAAPAAGPSAKRFLEALKARRQSRTSGVGKASLLKRLLSWGRRAAPEGRSASGGGWAATASRPPRPQPAWLLRLLDRLAVTQALGRRQAKYLRDLLSMFENLDLDQALRHAIPLGNDLEEDFRFVFGRPSPRQSLDVSPVARSAGGSLMVGGPDVYALLRQHYREAVERLKQQGKIDEALFVLVELLKEVEEAVQLLESAGRLREAAEIAEGHKLAAALVVRQWFLAGDIERAIDVARVPSPMRCCGSSGRSTRRRRCYACCGRSIWPRSVR